MKSIFVILIAVSLGVGAFAQSLPAIDNVPLTTKEDFRAADTIAAATANYILSTPSVKTNQSRLTGTSFLLKWMGGTPDFSFSIEKNVIQNFEKDLDLMSVYMACLTSAALHNRSVTDSKQLTIIAAKKFVAYIDNTNNNVAITSKLKKLSEANQKGQLEAYLEL